jgi:hypothetical protein
MKTNNAHNTPDEVAQSEPEWSHGGGMGCKILLLNAYHDALVGAAEGAVEVRAARRLAVHARAALVDGHVHGAIGGHGNAHARRLLEGHVAHVLPRARLREGHDGRSVRRLDAKPSRHCAMGLLTLVAAAAGLVFDVNAPFQSSKCMSLPCKLTY